MSDAKIMFMLVLVFLVGFFGSMTHQKILNHEYRMSQLECSK